MSLEGVSGLGAHGLNELNELNGLSLDHSCYMSQFSVIFLYTSHGAVHFVSCGLFQFSVPLRPTLQPNYYSAIGSRVGHL